MLYGQLSRKRADDMDPITIGIAIAGAKKLVETCSDIKDLSGSLEHLFSASEAKPKKKLSHNQKVLQQRTGAVLSVAGYYVWQSRCTGASC